MNLESFFPPGYSSLQDFILHYHENNQVHENTEKQEENQETVSLNLQSSLDDSPEDFKKEKVTKYVPKHHKQSGSKREYYERSNNSTIHPLLLLKPEEIEFEPITIN